MLAQQELITTELNVLLINLVIKEESGMIFSLNVSVLLAASGTVLSVLDVLQDNFTPLMDATALQEPFSMEFNVQS